MKDSCRELREWKTLTRERKQNKQNNHIFAETNNKIRLYCIFYGKFLSSTCLYYRLIVFQDNELQNWARDLHDNGYPAVSSGSVDKGFPESFDDRKQLIHFLTMAIFTSSCQHAAVNFSQMDVYGFHPNSPSLMRQPAPSKKGLTTLSNTMDTLATKCQSSLMVKIVNELTTVYPTEVSIRTSPRNCKKPEY